MRIRFRTRSGQYLQAADGGGGQLVATGPGPGAWETFDLVLPPAAGRPTSSGVCALRAHGRLYVQADGGGGGAVRVVGPWAREWETFTIERAAGAGEVRPGDAVGIRTHSGRYLGTDAQGQVVATAAGPLETFTVELEEAPAPFTMLVLGDSVMWGQGLREDDKLATRVQRRLQDVLGRRVDLYMFAHSGATAAPHPGDRAFLADPFSAVRPGELPYSDPSIPAQIEMARARLAAWHWIRPEQVDLIVVNGGINDVNVRRILSVDPTVGAGWIRGLTREVGFPPMRDLVLPRLLEVYPRARVVIPGYFPLVSTDSRLTEFALLLAALGISGFVLSPLLRAKVADQAEAFCLEANAGLRGLAQQYIGRVAFADPRFGPEHAYGATSALLWPVTSGMDPTDQLTGQRWADCEAYGHPDAGGIICRLASVGHPNVRGAVQYFQWIDYALARFLPAWRGAPGDDLVDTPWVDDDLPPGASPGGNERWTWISADPGPLSGARCHESALAPGLHQHTFVGAAPPLVVDAGERLFAHVWLDPANPPDELMLQWHDGTWEHRAYWGQDLLPLGEDGTGSRRYGGPLPSPGQWVRLEVPAAWLGLEGRSVDGMAFTLHGGRAAWDRAGKAGPPRLLEVSITPSPVRYDLEREYVVQARDARTDVPVGAEHGATAIVTNPREAPVPIPLGSPFRFTFRRRPFRSRLGDGWALPSLTVNAPGYEERRTVLAVSDEPPRVDATYQPEQSALPPAVLGPGQTAAVRIAMRNAGEVDWTPAEPGPFRLGIWSPQDNPLWGTGRVELPRSPVRPGEVAEFAFSVTAPRTRGRQAFQWRMLRELVTWFGEPTPALSIVVDDPDVGLERRPDVDGRPQYVVRARDRVNGVLLAGTADVANPLPQWGRITVPTNTVFTFRFRSRRSGRLDIELHPVITVRLDGYPEPVRFEVPS